MSYDSTLLRVSVADDSLTLVLNLFKVDTLCVLPAVKLLNVPNATIPTSGSEISSRVDLSLFSFWFGRSSSAAPSSQAVALVWSLGLYTNTQSICDQDQLTNRTRCMVINKF